MKKPKIGLTLSGGSALGFAHVGVIDVLLKNNIEIDIVTGTSMGAIVGGSFCSGLNVDKMIELASKVNYWKFVDFNLDMSGFFSGKKINEMLFDAFGNKKIENLEKAFACVAVDIETASVDVFKSGSLLDSVRSSMNLPALFIPYKYNGKRYVDGGIANNLPADVAAEMGADIIIGVDVLKENYPSVVPRTPTSAMINSFYLATMFQMNTNHQICDIVLFPVQKGVKQNSFNKKAVLESIEAGRVACEQAMPEILKIINNFENK